MCTSVPKRQLGQAIGPGPGICKSCTDSFSIDIRIPIRVFLDVHVAKTLI